MLYDMGRLVIVVVPKGLTSVMQVCDLVINKLLKQFIKDQYYNWRSEYVLEKRREIRLKNDGNDKAMRIQVKVDTQTMIKFVDAAVKKN